MGAVAAAADGQGSVASIDSGRKRSQAEEENKQDGENAPHLELCYMNFGVICDSGKPVAFRYHRCISNSRYWSKG